MSRNRCLYPKTWLHSEPWPGGRVTCGTRGALPGLLEAEDERRPVASGGVRWRPRRRRQLLRVEPFFRMNGRIVQGPEYGEYM